MKVRIYYNLTRKCWSIMDYESKLIYDHAHRVILHDAVCKVSEAGMNRAIKTGDRNVHAFIDGNLVAYEDLDQLKAAPKPKPKSKTLAYNPFRGIPNFTNRLGELVEGSSAMLFDTDAKAKIVSRRSSLSQLK